jgi:hypothetical protein
MKRADAKHVEKKNKTKRSDVTLEETLDDCEDILRWCTAFTNIFPYHSTEGVIVLLKRTAV